MRLLVLGGTGDATTLCRRLAAQPEHQVLVSLAGRTAAPAAQPVPARVGGFGGADALATFLIEGGYDAVVDATHPFAARISANAAAACAVAGTPLIALVRPAWAPVDGDRWIDVPDLAAAVPALGAAPRRVFLTIGRLGLAAFAAAPQHRYVIRTIDDAAEVAELPGSIAIRARGPFDVAAEIDLLREHDVDVLVTKNSGGAATYAKIEAARRLALPVVMIAPPPRPAGVAEAGSVEAVLAWLAAHAGLPADRGV